MVNLNEFQFCFLEKETMLLLALQEVYEKKITNACDALRSWGSCLRAFCEFNVRSFLHLSIKTANPHLNLQLI